MRNFTISCRVINGSDDCYYVNDTVEYPNGDNSNLTNLDYEDIDEYGQEREFRYFLFTFLLMFSVVTVFGNLLVITAVFQESALHKVTNYMIMSLAVADTIVGLVVMPFSAVQNAMYSYWIFGQDWCDLWHSVDVLASTASILNLCVISIDRFLAITEPMKYQTRMTDERGFMLITVVWVLSALISFPCILWWRAVEDRTQLSGYECLFTEDIGYLIFSSTVSFFLPLVVMVLAYAKVYQAAVGFQRNIASGTKRVEGSDGSIMGVHKGKSSNNANNSSQSNLLGVPNQTPELNRNNIERGGSRRTHHSLMHVASSHKLQIAKKIQQFNREKKAAKTLGTVMGVFVMCWLPFFVTNVISGICGDCVAGEVFEAVTWLGWTNSSMNPIIYACFSKEFRRAFSSILCCCCRSQQSRGSRGNSSRSFDDDLPELPNRDPLAKCVSFLKDKCCCGSRQRTTICRIPAQQQRRGRRPEIEEDLESGMGSNNGNNNHHHHHNSSGGGGGGNRNRPHNCFSPSDSLSLSPYRGADSPAVAIQVTANNGNLLETRQILKAKGRALHRCNSNSCNGEPAKSTNTTTSAATTSTSTTTTATILVDVRRNLFAIPPPNYHYSHPNSRPERLIV